MQIVPQVVCPLCCRPTGIRELHIHVEREHVRLKQRTVALIQAYHAGWDESQGACLRCWKRYRDAAQAVSLLRNANPKSRFHLNSAAVAAPFSMESTFNSSAARPSPMKNAPKPVNFYYSAPSARAVYLVGDFNRWHPTSTPMQRRPDGWWFAQVALAHGHHRYRFVVDGRPVLDPRATGVALNELNEEVSLVAVS